MARSDDETASGNGSPRSSRGWSAHRRHVYRLALGLTVILVIFVVALLPIAIQSMQDVLGRGPDPLHDLINGETVTPESAQKAEEGSTYFNLGMVDLDADSGMLTIAVSGNRKCSLACPSLKLTFLALDDDADQRRGLPPSVSLTLGPDDRIFSDSVQLPLRGQPSLYPFDRYTIWLGVAGEATGPNGKTIELSKETVSGVAIVTVQNRIPDMIMAPPQPIPHEATIAASDPFQFVAVQSLVFSRPAYLQVLAVVLVILVAVSAALAIFMRGLDELALGFGGIVLGVWGVRSILMPQSLGTVTAIDLALSWLILLLLLGLALRAALHFLHESELQPPTRVRRAKPRVNRAAKSSGADVTTN